MNTHFKKLFPILGIILIILFGLLLRSKDYFHGDFNYFLDQSRDLLLTRNIVVDKDITLIGGRAGIGGIFHGPLWLYMLVPTFILSSGDPFMTLIPIFFLINIAPILLAYITGTKLYNTSVGLIYALCIAISSLIIGASFNISNSNMMPILFMLYIFFAIKYMRDSSLYFPVILFVIGLSFQFESAFAIFLIPLTLLLFALTKKLPTIKIFLIGIFLFSIAVSTFIVFELRHNFLMSNSALKLVTNQIESTGEYSDYSHLSYRIIDRTKLLFRYFTFPFYNSIILGIFYIGLLLFSLLKMGRKKIQNDKELQFFIYIPLLFFSLYTFYPFPLWDHYIGALVAPSAFLFSILFIKNTPVLKKYRQITILTIVIIMIILPGKWIFEHYLGNKKDIAFYANYKEQRQIPDYIFSQSKNDNTINYFVYDPGFLTYNFDYLMWWYGKLNNKEITNEKDTHFIYLVLLEPPSWNPGAQTWWKQNIIKTKGDVVNIKTFKNSTTIVEKIKLSDQEEPVDPSYNQNVIFR